MSDAIGFESGILQRSRRGIGLRLTLANGETMPWINGGTYDPTEKVADIESEEVSATFKLVTPVGKVPRRLMAKGFINGEAWVAFETDFPHIFSLRPDESDFEPVAWTE